MGIRAMFSVFAIGEMAVVQTAKGNLPTSVVPKSRRQFEPDRSSHKETHTVWCVFPFWLLLSGSN